MIQIIHKNYFQYFLVASLTAHVAAVGILSGIHLNSDSTNKISILEIQLLPSIAEQKVASPSREQNQVTELPVRVTETHTVAPPIDLPALTTEAQQLSPESVTTPIITPPVTTKRTDVSETIAHDNRRLAAYIRSLTEIIGRQRTYPRLARVRGWEGTVTLRLQFLPGGQLHKVAMANSSGHDVLDQQALVMARGLSPWPLPPDELREREITVLVPVEFRLQK
jgi:protein TonB